MGISGLLGFLRPITNDSSKQEYAGKSLGIDASCYLYKGAYSCATELALGIPTNKYIDYILQVIKLLQACDIKPIAVFDGNKLPAKSSVNHSRESTRKDALRKGKALWYSNDKTAAAGFFRKALKVTWNMVLITIETLKSMGVEYVIAPFEADAQLTYLESQGLLNAVITEDSDLLAFGCKEVIYKLELNGTCKVIRQMDIGKFMDVNDFKFEHFRYMCIIAGCDYFKNISGIGIKRAHTFIQRYTRANLKIEKALPEMAKLIGVRTISIPNGYISAFSVANNTFLHQSVFDPKTRIELSLTPIPQPDIIPNKDRFYLYPLPNMN